MALDAWMLAIHFLIAAFVAAIAAFLLMDVREEPKAKIGHKYALIIAIVVGAFLAYFLLSAVVTALIRAF
jgi:hypothetical protein